jgi:hypothetical protein
MFGRSGWQESNEIQFFMKALLTSVVLLLFATRLGFAAEPKIIELWPEGVPNLKTNWSEEKIVDGRITNVHKPTLLMFAPEAANANGTAIVFCPGGGYVRIAIGGADGVARLLAISIRWASPCSSLNIGWLNTAILRRCRTCCARCGWCVRTRRSLA